MKRRSRTTRTIQTTREDVYRDVFFKALEYWLATNAITGKIHDYELKIGSGFGMSLFYNNDVTGRTSGNEDQSLWYLNHLKRDY